MISASPIAPGVTKLIGGFGPTEVKSFVLSHVVCHWCYISLQLSSRQKKNLQYPIFSASWQSKEEGKPEPLVVALRFFPLTKTQAIYSRLHYFNALSSPRKRFKIVPTQFCGRWSLNSCSDVHAGVPVRKNVFMGHGEPPTMGYGDEELCLQGHGGKL